MFGPAFSQFNMGSRRGMGVPSPIIPFTGSVLLSQTTVWSAANIDVMTTPLTVVRAPGSGRVAIPLLCVVRKPAYNPATAANPIGQMYYANDVGGTNLFSDSPTLNLNSVNAETSSQSNRFATNARGIGAVPTSENQAIVMRGNIDAPGGSGSKSLKVTVYYVIAPIA